MSKNMVTDTLILLATTAVLIGLVAAAVFLYIMIGLTVFVFITNPLRKHDNDGEDYPAKREEENIK